MENKMYHTTCTCYFGRICGTSHRNEQDFESKRCKVKDCTTCKQVRNINTKVIENIKSFLGFNITDIDG